MSLLNGKICSMKRMDLYVPCYSWGDHVNLLFARGTEIEDPYGMLEGTGKKFRHLKIRDQMKLNPMN
jgi:hypothetical protein